MTLPIYLDYSATTPTDPNVLKKMLPYFTEYFGNMHSRNHPYGWTAEDAVEKARLQIANAINVSPKSIIFTSGATESNNLALKGCARFLKSQKGKNHIITTNIEHKCVLETLKVLEIEGFNVTYLPVNSDGLVTCGQVQSAITSNTGLVSIIAVHNEIGVIQPIYEIAEMCHSSNIFFHTDAAQALGKIKIDASKFDLMSLSAHKFYGPKGIGALYIKRDQQPRPKIYPLFSGGGQEHNLRSGTIPVPLCVGIGEAAELAESMREVECKKYKRYFNEFIDYIMSNLDHVYLNGSRTERIPHNINLSFRFVEGESLMMKVPQLAISSGSACTSSSLEASYVLKALGVDEELAHTSLRFSFGRLLKDQDIQYASQLLIAAVTELRGKSPLYEMFQEGIDLSTINWNT